MPAGPGKYDELCSSVRVATGAMGVVLVVLGGKDGHGFSVQAPLAITLTLPELLREIANEIEATLNRGSV